MQTKQRKEVGQLLAGKRIEAGYSQHKLAKVLKLTNAQFISNVERGSCFPAVKHMKLWCNTVGADPYVVADYIIEDFKDKVFKDAKL